VRRYERETFKIPVILNIQGKEISGYTHNICPDGLLVFSKIALSSGTPMTLKFSFGEHVCHLNISGQVVFCRLSEKVDHTLHVTGIKFCGIRDFEKKILSTVIEELKHSTATQEKSLLDIQVSSDSLAQEITVTTKNQQTIEKTSNKENIFRDRAGVNFELTEEQKALREMVRKFVQKEIVPVAAHYDKSGEFPWDIIKKAFEMGLLTCYMPERYGGGGLGLFETALISEELGAGCTAMLTSIMVNLLATGPLLLAGTEEQKEKYLAPYCHKPTLFSFCFTEPDAGSDPSRMATTAQLKGEEYIINGSKCFITNAAVADYLMVFATVDRTLKTAGITPFIVPSKTEGVKIGKTLDKMGQRASNTAEIFFDDVRIPIANRIGDEGKGFRIGLLSLARSRVNVAAGAVGLARTALELTLKRVHSRIQFDNPLANFQYVQFRLSDMARDVEAGRLLAWRAAYLHDTGQRFAKESSMAKDFCADLAMRTSSEALDLFGGYGYSKEFPIEKMMRDAKLLQIYEGPTPIHKTIVFRELAKEHGFEISR
jgi:acyl-CoA dehydrogenase